MCEYYEESKHLSSIWKNETTAQRYCSYWVDWSAETTYLRQSLSNRAATLSLIRERQQFGN